MIVSKEMLEKLNDAGFFLRFPEPNLLDMLASCNNMIQVYLPRYSLAISHKFTKNEYLVGDYYDLILVIDGRHIKSIIPSAETQDIFADCIASVWLQINKAINGVEKNWFSELIDQ